MFHCHSLGPNESIAEYIAELRHLAASCDFGTFLEQALHDRLVLGIRSESKQSQLLTQSDIKLSKVVQLALILVPATKSSQALKNTDYSPMQMYKLTPHKPHSSQWEEAEREKPSYRCEKTNHTLSAWGFLEAKCLLCGKLATSRECMCKSKASRTCHEKTIPHNNWSAGTVYNNVMDYLVIRYVPEIVFCWV